MKVILIHGKSRSGKNTVSSILLPLLSNAVEIGNADAVRELARDFYKWDEIKDDKGRKLLIDITDAGYNYDPHFWEKKSLHTVQAIDDIYQEGVKYLLVPDWRYKSTYEFWKERLGEDNVVTVLVLRPNFDNGLSEAIKKDKSENMLNDFLFDRIIFNDQGVEELKPQVNNLVDLCNEE